MKTDPNKSLAQNVHDIFNKLKKNRRYIKHWEEGLIRQAEDDLNRNPVRVLYEREDCLRILRENDAHVLESKGKVRVSVFHLSWPHGTMDLWDNIDSSIVCAGVFVQLWNIGIDAGDAMGIARRAS